MYTSNPIGFHTKLTDEVKALILGCVSDALTLNVTAKIVGIHPKTLKNWMRQGEEDLLEEKWTPFAQLFLEIEQKRGIELACFIDDMKNRRKNWQAAWELLRALNREDYGVDAEEFKELLQVVVKLNAKLQMYESGKVNHGGLINGREMDTEGNKEERRITQGIGSQEGQADSREET